MNDQIEFTPAEWPGRRMDPSPFTAACHRLFELGVQPGEAYSIPLNGRATGSATTRSATTNIHQIARRHGLRVSTAVRNETIYVLLLGRREAE